MKKTIILLLLAAFSFGANAQSFDVNTSNTLQDKNVKHSRNAEYRKTLKSETAANGSSGFAFSGNPTLRSLTDMVYTYNEGDNHYTGLLGTPGTMTALPTAYPNEIQCGEYINGILYITDYYNNNGTDVNRFGTVDPTTGVFTQIGTTAPDAIGMAWNPVTNKTYVSIWESPTSGPLHELNLTDGTTTPIGNIGQNATIAIDNNGICYAVRIGDATFGTVDLTTGAFTQISTIPFQVAYVQNMSVDRTDNELYWSAREYQNTTNSTGLYKINKSTGELTLVGTFPSNFNCESFTILSDYTANQDVPAAPANLTATPDAGGAFSCVLNWTNPSLTAGGDALSSLTQIVITRDGTPIASINNPVAGDSESYTDATPTGGNHTYAVYAVNSDGDGLKASTSTFVGIDVAVVSIDQPVNGPNLTNTETVQVVVKNNGFYPVASISVTLEVNGTVVATENMTNIAAQAEASYTFTVTADLSAVQTHIVKIYTVLEDDIDLTNDAIVKTVENYGNVAIMGSAPTVTSCDIRFMDNGVGQGYTPSGNEIITFYPENAGDMVSITFNDLATAIDLALGSYDAVYVLNGTFTLDNLNSVTNEDILGSFAGNYADNLPEPITADNQDGALTVYFQIGNYFGMTERGWDATITCVEPPAIDAAIKTLEVPVSGLLTNSETITVTVLNRGGDILSNIPVVCKINDTALPIATIPGPLAPWATTVQIFTADLSAFGNYDIVVYTDMPNDENHANDTVKVSTACLPAVAITWDFEQGMPDDFTLRVLDAGVAHSTILFPNNEAWAIFTGNTYLKPLGTKCAISQSWFNPVTEAANRWMITPKVELGTGAMLQWDASCYESPYFDGYTIKLSTTTNETASFTETLFTIAAENYGWTNRVVDLSAYAGQQVYIAFIQNSNNMNIIAIDNIKLLGDAGINTGIVKHTNPAVHVFPNPATDKFVIENAAGMQVKIYDVSGKIVVNTLLQQNTETVNISRLASGIYFVEMQDQQTRSTVKLIKR